MVLTNSSDDPFVSSCRWILSSFLSFRSRVCRTLFWTWGRTGTCAASCACVVCASTCVFRTFCCEPSRTHLFPSAWLSPPGPLDFAGTDPLPPLPPMNACHVARETRGGFLSFLPFKGTDRSDRSRASVPFETRTCGRRGRSRLETHARQCESYEASQRSQHPRTRAWIDNVDDVGR